MGNSACGTETPAPSNDTGNTAVVVATSTSLPAPVIGGGANAENAAGISVAVEPMGQEANKEQVTKEAVMTKEAAGGVAEQPAKEEVVVKKAAKEGDVVDPGNASTAVESPAGAASGVTENPFAFAAVGVADNAHNTGAAVAGSTDLAMEIRDFYTQRLGNAAWE